MRIWQFTIWQRLQPLCQNTTSIHTNKELSKSILLHNHQSFVEHAQLVKHWPARFEILLVSLHRCCHSLHKILNERYRVPLIDREGPSLLELVHNLPPFRLYGFIIVFLHWFYFLFFLWSWRKWWGYWQLACIPNWLLPPM